MEIYHKGLEKLSKNLITISIIFFGICFLIGAWKIASALEIIGYNNHTNIHTTEQQHRYELIVVNENNIIFFDKESGEHWRKFIDSEEGPTNWEKQRDPWN